MMVTRLTRPATDYWTAASADVDCSCFRRYGGFAVRTLAIALAAALLLTGCGSTDQPASGGGTPTGASTSAAAPVGDVTVFAAASLTETFTQIGKDFEAAHP